MKQLHISKQITNRESQSLTLYLQDIARISRITAEEEAELAARIRSGDTIALNTLVSANLRFVVSVAKQYQYMGLNLHDLINEGNLGLVRAAEKFDETRGFKFISYAVWWIRQGIMQALAENSRVVRLPLNKISAINKIKKAVSVFEQTHQRPPIAEEIAEMTEISLTEVETCMRNSSWSLSMDAPVQGKDDDTSYHDLMASKDSPSPETGLIKNSLELEIDQILHFISEREAYVVRLYYGIGTNDPVSLDQIGETLGLSKERVRQIKQRALNRLKKSTRGHFLVEYLG